MHFYNFHIKDYRAKTAHLTPLEHYIYRTLIDWYYLNEKPFESVEQIARYLLLPLTDENRTAINAVLDEFFNYHKGKYHHSRINEEVKDYRHKNGNKKVTSGNATDNATVTDDNAQANAKSNGNALSASDRQARYKERKKMLKALSDKGVTLDGNATFDDVCNAYNAHFANADNANNNTTDNATVTQNNGKNGARTINQEPITKSQESSNAPTQLEKNQTQTANEQAQPSDNELLDTTPSVTKKSKSKSAKFDAKTYPIGDSVDPDLWNDFVDMRLSIKKPLTEQACKRFVKEFNEWAEEGISVNKAISESIKNSWQGVFKEKGIIQVASPTLPPQRAYQSQAHWTSSQVIDPIEQAGGYENYIAKMHQDNAPRQMTQAEIEESQRARQQFLAQFRQAQEHRT